MALLERDSQLAAVSAYLAEAGAGHGRLVFVGGEAGVGKTTFVRPVLAIAGDAARSASGACDGSMTPAPRDGVTMDDVAKAHQADLATQGGRNVNYLRYWVDEDSGSVFCLVEAPSAEAANGVHREAHGLVADEIFQVQEGA
jgi:nucleoside-triphosphatase THEP1